MSDQVRVRIAPAPTGHMHLGNARTALFNWLFARHNGGKFILRIDDTDENRSTEQSIRAILEAMRWLKMDWDEGPEVGGDYGPYIQSERIDIYKQYGKKLVEDGRAYYCYCSKEEIDAERQSALEKGQNYKYSGRCKRLTDRQISQFKAEGRKPTIRIDLESLPGFDESDRIVVDDLVLGRVEFALSEFDDFIIFKSSGMPVYNFATVIDDSLMKITHIIRASEHLSNTPRQILILRALEMKPAVFAHVPMVLGSNKGEKLSKRHGAVSVEWYRDNGYLPDAMINFLVRLGWSYDDKEEIFSVDELIEKFDLANVGKSGSVFDINKLNWLNSKYIAEMPIPERTQAVIPYLRRAGLISDEEIDLNWLEKVVEVVGERMTVLSDIVRFASYLFGDLIPEYDEKALKKWMNKEYVPRMLAEIRELMSKIDDFTAANVESVLREYAANSDVKPVGIMQPIRVALTGVAAGPGLFEIMELLGKERVIKRLDAYLGMN